ncbi:MAG TPA: ATP-binding protein, partial [Gemmatimonadota bacterium]|nr:ATP-binding protein [Gemmatimonadota bacterium]
MGALDERRLLTGVYVARLSIASALAIAATLVRTTTPDEMDRGWLAVVVVGIPLLWTLLSILWSRHRTVGAGFLTLQVLHDLALTTTAVELTGGIGSEFAFVYILLIAVAGLLLGSASAMLTALGSVVSYMGIAYVQSRPQLGDEVVDLPVWSGPPGALLWSLLLTASVFLVVGAFSGLVARRIRAQRARLEELEEQLASARVGAQDILNTVESGILSVNADEELDFVNYTARAQLGITGSPSARDLKRQAGAERVLEMVLETLRSEREVEYAEVTLVGAGGEDRAFSIATTVLYDPKGSKRGAAAILKDMQNVKRLEELARQADRLKAVTELAAGLAHEIQNPLAAIRSSVELLSTNGQERDDESRRLLDLVVREADRLAALITDFMAFSRMTLKSHARVNLVEVVEDALEVQRVSARREGLRFSFSSPGRSYSVEGDHDLLKQVVLNLLTNAVAAVDGREEAKIEVRVGGNPPLPGLERAPGPYVALEVRDNGEGIDPAVQPRIFDPFFTTRRSGFGMGLAIVHRIVDLHGGMIWVESGL